MAVAALASAAVPTAASLAAPTAASCARVRAEARTGTAEQVMLLFITTGVLRQNPTCAYDLLTDAARKGSSRAAFAAGRAPTPAYRTKKPRSVLANYVPRVRLADQVGSWITLEAPDARAHTFEIVLRKRHGRWLVDYWARAVGFQ